MMFDKIIRNLQESKNTAFVINDKRYSYAELFLLVKKYNNHFLKNSHISLIGIVMHNDLDTYAMMIASFLSDCGYVILNLAHPIERNTTIANDAGIKFVFSSTATDNGKVPQDLTFVSPEVIPEPSSEVTFEKPQSSSIAYVLFTSGSTGNPKGVKITKKNLDAFAQSIASTPIAVKETDSVLQMYDLTFDASILMLVPALCAGATIYTTDPSRIKIIDVARILTTYPITYMFLVPSVISLLKSYIADINIPSLSILLLGGEPVTRPILELIHRVATNAELWNFYGPTEATVGVVITRIDDKVLECCYNDIVPIGNPMPGVKHLIMEGNTIITKIGQKGELLVGGDQITDGYVNDEAKNKNSFYVLNYEEGTERFYATGDLVYKNIHGNLTYCGRKDHQVKIQGYRIELSEIEYHARNVTDRPVVAIVKEEDSNQYLYLFVENYHGLDDTIISYLQKKLPPFMVPRDIIHVKQFPMTASDKIDRVKLHDLIVVS